MAQLQLWWGAQQARAHYDPTRLQGADRARAAWPRAATAQAQWECSRGLLACVDAHRYPYSLSHRLDVALLGLATDGRLGVDLEWMKPRNVHVLAPWCCDVLEQQWLRRAVGVTALRRFYLLWTLKEAFLKAAGLAFPADMARVGLARAKGRWRLRCDAHAMAEPEVETSTWQAMSWCLEGGWVVSAVWSASSLEPTAPIWRVVQGDLLPRVRRSFYWGACSPKIPAGNG